MAGSRFNSKLSLSLRNSERSLLSHHRVESTHVFCVVLLSFTVADDFCSEIITFSCMQ